MLATQAFAHSDLRNSEMGSGIGASLVSEGIYTFRRVEQVPPADQKYRDIGFYISR